MDIVRLAALLRAAHAFLSGGLHQQAQMLIEQLIAALDAITGNDQKVASAAWRMTRPSGPPTDRTESLGQRNSELTRRRYD